MFALSAGNFLLIMILLTLIFLGALIGFIVHKARQMVRSTMGVGVRTLLSQVKEADIKVKQTPRSLSGGDIIYEPMILRDYPNFHKSTVFAKAKKCLTDCLDAIETKNINKVMKDEYGDGIQAYVAARIGDSNKVQFDQVRIHKHTISGYNKTEDYSTVVIQMAYEYMIEINGRAAQLQQMKAEIEYTYLYRNVDNVGVIGTNCPTCGGPIETASQDKCEYCGTGVIGIVEKIWVFTNMKDL